LLVNCLQLADYVGMTGEGIKNNIEILRNATRSSDNIEINDAANAIVKVCGDELSVLVPPAGKRRPEPTNAGIYKKRIKAAKNSREKPKQIRLISLEALERLKRVED